MSKQRGITDAQIRLIAAKIARARSLGRDELRIRLRGDMVRVMIVDTSQADSA